MEIVIFFFFSLLKQPGARGTQKLRKLKLAAAQLTSGQSKNNLVFFFGEIKVFLGRENLGAHGFESGPLAQGTISRLCDKLEVEASCWRDGKQERAGAEPAARGCCVGFPRAASPTCCGHSGRRALRSPVERREDGGQLWSRSPPSQPQLPSPGRGALRPGRSLGVRGGLWGQCSSPCFLSLAPGDCVVSRCGCRYPGWAGAAERAGSTNAPSRVGAQQTTRPPGLAASLPNRGRSIGLSALTTGNR